jgi:hypothetical protein
MATNQLKAKPVPKITAADKVKAKAAAIKPQPKPASKTTNNPPNAPKASQPGRKQLPAAEVRDDLPQPVTLAGAARMLTPPPVSTVIAANTHKAAAEIHAVLKHAHEVTDFSRSDAWDFMFATVVNNLLGSPITRRHAAPHVEVFHTHGTEQASAAWRRLNVMSTPLASQGLHRQHRRSLDTFTSWGLCIDAWLADPRTNDAHVMFVLAYNSTGGTSAVYVPTSSSGGVDLQLSGEVAQACLLMLGLGGQLPHAIKPDVRRMVRDLGLLDLGGDVEAQLPPSAVTPTTPAS